MSFFSHPIWRWVFIAVLAAGGALIRFGKIESRRVSSAQVSQSYSQLGKLSQLAPELVLHLMNTQFPPSEQTFLAMNWEDLGTHIRLQFPKGPAIESPVVDAWGSPFYGVFDFNKDGVVPDPEVQVNPALRSERSSSLRRSSAVFSAGPDRNPTTWQDNIKNW